VNANDDPSGPDLVWQKTPFTNLIRYKPSQVYFARFRVKGKLIRRSLKTTVLSVAKLRLADLEKVEQQKAQKPQQRRRRQNDFRGRAGGFPNQSG
jgi:hypothetical protein